MALRVPLVPLVSTVLMARTAWMGLMVPLVPMALMVQTVPMALMVSPVLMVLTYPRHHSPVASTTRAHRVRVLWWR